VAQVKYKTQDEKGQTSWYEQEVPDDASAQDVINHIESEYGRRVLELEKVQGLGERAIGAAKDVARGLVRPAATLLDAAVNPTIFPLLNARMGRSNPLSTEPTGGIDKPWSPHQEALRSVLPIPGQESGGEELARGALEGVGGAMAVPLGGVRNLAAGAAAGAGGALGSNLTGGNQMGESLGSLVAGILASMGSAAKTNAPALAGQALEGVSPEQLAAAKTRMEWLQRQGSPSNLSQGMTRASNIDDVVEALANSRYGDQTQKVLRAQPEILNIKARGALRQLPGTPSSSQDVANRAQEAATDSIDALRKEARAAYTAKLVPGAKVPAPLIEAFDKKLDDIIAANPNNASAVGLAKAVKGRLRLGEEEVPPSAILDAAGAPMTPGKPPTTKWLDDPAQLKGAVDDAIQNFGANAINTQAGRADLNRYAQDIRNAWKGTVRAGTPGMEDAAQASRRVYTTQVDPTRKSITGRVAGLSGASDVKEATDKLTSMFNKGTSPASTRSEILTFERDIREKHPGLFADAVATNLADRITKALPTKDARVSDVLAMDLKKALIGNPQQERGLRDMLAGAARSKDLPEKPVVDGFMNFTRVADMLANRPQRVSGLPQLDLLREAEKANITVPLRPGFEFSQRIKMSLSRDAYQTMDRLLNDPEGVALLQKLAKESVMNPGAQAAVASFLGATGQETGQD